MPTPAPGSPPSASTPASTLPPSAAPARTLAALHGVLRRLGPASPPPAPPTLAGTTRPAFVTGTQVRRDGSEWPMQAPPRLELPYSVELPYPAAVYRAAAEALFEKLEDVQLGVCVQGGPHVPGRACPVVTVIDLLRGVADAIDPPAPVVDVTQAEPAAPASDPAP